MEERDNYTSAMNQRGKMSSIPLSDPRNLHRLNRIGRGLGRIFLTGLLTVLPLAITVYVSIWLFTLGEKMFGTPLQRVMPLSYHVGMGLALAVLVVFGVGLAMRAYLFRRLFRVAEHVLLGVPLVRSIYTAMRDLLGLFAQHKEPALQVVMVRLPELNLRLLGFVTRREFDDLPKGVGTAGEIAVYLPMSYQVGGYTVFIPLDRVQPVDMSREDAMKFILTAGLHAQSLPAPPATDQLSGRTPL
jgi:uncharacterized membrane protein